jgi:hypothetical protein
VKYSAFRVYIAACITHNQPIDRQWLACQTGVTGNALESLINRAVCAFCLVSQGSTGNRSGVKNVPRGSKR